MQIPESWVIAKGFLIRHKPSGKYIPSLPKGRRRGSSILEPTSKEAKLPRFFQSEISAKNFLSQWCRGQFICRRIYDGDESVEIRPVPSRKKEEMKIIPVVLVHKDL